MNWTRYYDENFPNGIEVVPRQIYDMRTEGPLLRDDPVFQQWCRECPDEVAAWRAEWKEEQERTR